MIWAVVTFFSFVALGALLGCVNGRERSRAGKTFQWKVVPDYHSELPEDAAVLPPCDPKARQDRFEALWRSVHGEDAVVPQLLAWPIGASPKPRFDECGKIVRGQDSRLALVKWPDGRRELTPWHIDPDLTWASKIVSAGLICFVSMATVVASKKSVERRLGSDGRIV